MRCSCTLFVGSLVIVLFAIARPADLYAAEDAYRIGGGNRVLSATDAVLLEEAFRAADRNDWQTARRLAAQSADQVAALLVEWRYVVNDDSDARFEEIVDFLNRHPGWPWRERLLVRAEEAMSATLPPEEILNWFGDRRPETSAGSLRLAGALIGLARTEEGTEVIRTAWINHTFNVTEENRFLASHGSVLRLDDHRARLVRLLARDNIEEARRQLERVDAQSKQLAEARITLKLTPASSLNIPASLGATERNEPWLIYDHARALRRHGRDSEAWEVMRRAPNPLPDPESWWLERHIMARDALKVNAFDVSYGFASQHHMSTGGGFADAEFLAGWIALRHRAEPDAALKHFRTLAGGVSFPISRARARYWTGRALEALGRSEEATISYRNAIQDSTTFYGQLASTHLSEEPVLTLDTEMPEPDRRLDNDERIRAMNAAIDIGRPHLLRTFLFHIANEDPSPGRMRYLVDFMSAASDRTAALRLAKLASYSNVTLVPYLYPIVDVPEAAVRPRVEPALILGVARQESEFDAAAVSSAGARGLMQLMPRTAEQTARAIGVAYSQDRLTNPHYNMQIGAAHLEELLERWNGSYVLTIAAYNAGSTNVARWIDTYGDPRAEGVDAIDWIEFIPFGETRNYVQRVMENIQVYRSRLAGKEHRLEITADFSRS